MCWVWVGERRSTCSSTRAQVGLLTTGWDADERARDCPHRLNRVGIQRVVHPASLLAGMENGWPPRDKSSQGVGGRGQWGPGDMSSMVPISYGMAFMRKGLLL